MRDYLESYRRGEVKQTEIGGYVPFGQELIDREFQRDPIPAFVPGATLPDVALPASQELARIVDERTDHRGMVQASGGSGVKWDLDPCQTADVEPYRAYFRGMKSWQRTCLNNYMDNADTPYFEPQKGSDWAAYLADEAPSARVVNFVQWQADLTVAYNDNPPNQAHIAACRETYKDKVKRAVEAGWLPEMALECIPAVDTIPVVIGDVFDVELAGRGAYCDRPVPRVVIGQISGLQSFDHEMSHAVIGDFFEPQLVDCVNTTIELGLQDGDFTLNPYRRTDNNDKYFWKRHLGAAIGASGIVPIEDSLFIEAAIEPDADGDANTEMRTKATEAYPGTDIWAYSAKLAGRHQKEVAEQFPDDYPYLHKSAGDMYAGYSVGLLGAEKRHVPISTLRDKSGTWVDQYAQTNARRQDAGMTLTPGRRSYIIEAYTVRRVAEDFRSGTAFFG